MKRFRKGVPPVDRNEIRNPVEPPLPPFVLASRCVKCGYGDPPGWKPGGLLPPPGTHYRRECFYHPSAGEHLCRTCLGCGYNWAEAVL